MKQATMVVSNVPADEDDGALIEALAALEHEQWRHWTQAVAGEVSPPKRARWESGWVDYGMLNKDARELDRVWARKVVALLRARKLIP